MTKPTPPARKHADRIRELAETRQQILAMPAEKAMAAILDHPQPAAVVHSFPEEDLHFLIHDIGPVDAMPLLTLASNRQWEYMLDMETWKRDQLDFRSVTYWLQLLLQADPDRLVKWCFDEKLEFLELFLFRNIELRLRESEESPSDFGEGFFTDDDSFYVRLVDYPVTTPEEEAVKERRNDVLGQLLYRMSSFDHPRYQGLLIEAANVIPAETEEELLRLRTIRLSEKGFMPFHEAIGVYQPLRPGDLAARGRKVIQAPTGDELRVPVPQFAASFLEGDTLFVRALRGVHEHHLIELLQMEFASLCNQVISADKTVVQDRRQLRAVVAKVNGYLSIGLERLTPKSPANREASASALLQRHLLADIFRAGFTIALQLHWQASRWRRESWWRSHKLSLAFWDEDWLGQLGGLMIDRPKYYDPTLAGSHYREFQTREEIEAIRRQLIQVITLDQLFSKLVIPEKALAGIHFLTYKNLLLTLWARAWLKMPLFDAQATNPAIPLSAFESFYSALWTDGENRRFIADDKKTEFLQWAASVSGQTPTALSDQLGMVFEALFVEIERELAPVKTGNLDPRHVHLFLLKV